MNYVIIIVGVKMKLRMKKRKNKWINIVVILIMVICFSTLCISLYNILKWKIDSNDTKKLLEEIYGVVNITIVNDSADVEIIEQDDSVDNSNPYWDYIEMNLIDVDFEELKLINEQTKGWIQVNDTNVNYPFVQASDNDYYLNHSFNKSLNTAGWVFLDYRNNIDTMDKNTILYAHGRYDNTMFGTLRNILTNGWLDDTDNYVIKLSTEKENTLWQVFSIYRIPTTNDYLQINFDDGNEFMTFSQMLIDRSDYNFNTMVSANDKILTLSTCYDDYDKMVIHAKLIKKEDGEKKTLN